MKKIILSFVTLIIAGANLFAQRTAFVGTTVYGGAGNGSIFFTDTTFTSVSNLYGFTGGPQGYSPESGVTLAPNNKFYGVFPQGGANTYGGIYEITANGTYAVLYDFMNTIDGANPKAAMCIAANGTLYGTTTSGGAFGYGTLFSYLPGSATIVTLHDFTGTDGSTANTSLIQAADGMLYGTTNAGGSTGYGVLFSYDIGAPLYTVLHSFSFPADGTNPTELFEASDGKLYGLTGLNGPGGNGTLFNYDPIAPAFTINHSFTGIESFSPFGGLAEGAPGYLYGVTSGGGSMSYGNIFEYYFPSNTYTNKYNFTGGLDGASPEGGLIKSSFNNKFYGTCYSGGSNNGGTLFEFDPSGPTFTKLIDFGGAGNGQGPMRMALTEYVPLQSTISSNPALCNSICNGSATVIPTGGTAPYFYSWSPSGGSSATATALCAGTYTCTITDTDGSIVSYSVAVLQPSGITGADTGTDVSCNGGSDGTAATNPIGGTLPYTFLWNAAAGNQTTQIAIGLPAGIYSVQITDANGCMATDFHPVNQPAAPLNINATQTDPGCAGTSTSEAASAASGGTIPYSYSWSNGSSDSTATGLSAAQYTAYVTDFNGCAANMAINITEQTTYIVGHVSTLNDDPVQFSSNSAAYAFKYQPGSAGFDTMDIAGITVAGEFDFFFLDSGQYLVKIILDTTLYPNAIPTYNGNAFQWDSSVVVNHGCLVNDTVSIQVLEVDTTLTGPGFISGYIIEETGFGTGRYGNGTGPHHICAPGGPLKGVDVKLGKNPGGGIQARTMTNSTGYYEFTNLPLDSFKIYVDIPNLPMDSTRSVILDATNSSSVQNNYFADSASVYIADTLFGIGIHASVLIYENNFTVFPNPAKDNLFVSFDMSKETNVNIELYNAMGQVLQSETIKHVTTGTNTHQVNIASLNLKAGVYFISVVSEGQKYTQRLIVVE